MLSGEFPLSIFNISSLTEFSMAYNQLQGRLPANIGITLPKLQYLNLCSNQLEGPIPTSLCNASELVTIFLSANRLSGLVPSDLGKLQHLSLFIVIANSIEASDASDWKFLDSLINCSCLTELALSSNLLRGVLPKSVANLSTQLQYLDIGDNHISGSIPSGIGNLVNLQFLAMNSNLLTGNIPEDIGKVKTLQINRLTGNIPSSLGNLSQLTELVISDNFLEGPASLRFGSLQFFTHLILAMVIASLPSTSQYVNLSSNSFVGPLPLEVGHLINLGVLSVSRNRLSGDIPTALGQCAVLEALIMHNNLFQGVIPPSLSNIKGLEYLDLSSNNLSGPIPQSLESFHYLSFVNLSFNHLSGEVPTKGVFGNATALSLLGNGGLCGGIPELHLRSCPSKTESSKKINRSGLLRVIIPISVVFFLAAFLSSVFIIWKLKSRRNKTSPQSLLDDQYPKVSYAQLVRATDGFSSTNLLGTGRYGTVYEGSLDLEHGNTMVAVKIFNLQILGSSESFMTECEAFRTVRHRILIRIVTSCSSLDLKGSDFNVIVLEFMPNGTLEGWLHPREDNQHVKSNFGLLQRLNIAIDVANAMDYLHHDCQPPIVHCDLKPGNVLLDNDMVAHVGDFGLAKILSKDNSTSPQASVTSTAIRGSIGYVAPEYGVGSRVSTSGDVHSYGILLLEMFTGKCPVDNEFGDGQTLCTFVETAFPERIMDIIDSSILLQDAEDRQGHNSIGRIQECLVSIVKIGLLCSKNSAGERKNMRDVVAELHAIKDAYTGVRNS